MKKEYKIWIHIEEYTPDSDEYFEPELPELYGVCGSLQEAIVEVNFLTSQGHYKRYERPNTTQLHDMPRKRHWPPHGLQAVVKRRIRLQQMRDKDYRRRGRHAKYHKNRI